MEEWRRAGGSTISVTTWLIRETPMDMKAIGTLREPGKIQQQVRTTAASVQLASPLNVPFSCSHSARSLQLLHPRRSIAVFPSLRTSSSSQPKNRHKPLMVVIRVLIE